MIDCAWNRVVVSKAAIMGEPLVRSEVISDIFQGTIEILLIDICSRKRQV